MYESFYKLSTKPFRLSPDPHFFYPSAGHKRALSYLLYGLNQGEGFVVITGAPGTGKTTLAHKLLAQIDAQSVLVAHLTSTQIEAEDLLRLVAASFKLRSENVSKAGLLKDIESYLLARSRERKRCLLVVDEAQNLPPRSIEELRMLSNFQVGSKALLQIFLLGQEQFRTMLNSANFEQLRQRVIADYHLQPLDAEETRRYIEARLQIAHWQNDPQFDAGAYAAIFEHTRGLPRRINMFCDRLMLYGFLESLHLLTRDSVNAVIHELSQDGVTRHDKVVYTPVESGDVRTASTGASPIAHATHIAPPDSVTPFEATPTPVVAASPAATERTRLVTPFPAPATVAIPERTAPTAPGVPIFAAPDQPTVTTSVFAPKLSRESRGESAIPPSRIDLRPTVVPPLAHTAAQSLAVTESRWLLVLAGTIFLVLIVAAWLYPSWRNLFELPPPTESAPAATQTESSSAGLTALPGSESDASTVNDNQRADALPPSTETAQPGNPNEPGFTGSDSTMNSPVPAMASAQTLTTPPPSPSEVSATPALEIPRPAPSAAPEPPPPTPALEAPVSVAPAAPDDRSARSKPASKTAIATPQVQAPIVKISERELALLLRKFSRLYEQGNLASFIALFDRDVSTEDHNTAEAVRHDYAELFRKTAARQITFGEIHWDITGDVSHGSGSFEVRVRATPDAEYRVATGTVRLRVQKRGSSVLITALYHKSN